MCGIVGARHDWLRQRGLDPEAAMHAAVRALAWRGPDGLGVVRAGEWWLGCARLAIGPRRSRQPVVRRAGRFAGVLNGAVTNARESWSRLRPALARRAQPPNDAWLPLVAVERGDVLALRQLAGHHAYAIVDVESGELVFGQDRHGEKPFYCLHGRAAGGRLLHAFASTPSALEALGMPAIPTPRRLGDWFRFGFADPLPHRFDARLCLAAVPARGEPLVAAVAGGRWWRPWPGTKAPPADAPARRHAVADLRPRAIETLARCTDTTAAAALSLSGGVDSSCLAAGLRALGRALPAYQFHAHGTSPAEREVARQVAAHCQLPFRPVDGGPDLLAALPPLTAMAGLPLGDPSVLAVHAVATAAAADGIRVLLGGEGADERFLGYRRYRALAWMPHLPWLRRLQPRWSMRYLARWWRAVVADDPAAALLAVTPPAFGAEVLAASLGRRRCWRDDAPPAADTPADRVLAARDRDLDGYLRCDLLPKVDVATMAAGIEARCPWLDGAFADCGGSRRELGKVTLRRAFAGDLPATVFRQPKRGFALPLDRWFRGGSPWLDVLAEPRSRHRPHLRPGGLQTAIDRHRSGRSNLGHGLYLLLACEVFLRWREQESAAPGTKPRPGA
ncbi:MAG: hypothetical protein KF830_10455 [Planctomycetes bacterium]|nr:hypothetical protein [Planctomycetota bacterium]